MNWEVAQAASSIIGTIALALTVVYLAIQVRRNTKATYSQTYQFATQALGDMAALVGETKDKARVFSVGMAEPNNLGSGLIDYSQKMTMAAMQIADMNV